MKSNMRLSGLNLRTFILLVWSVRLGDGYSCPYGQTCGFEPALPGRAPPCAKPGLTYCTHPQPYPEQIIRKLVELGQYDTRTLLSDESRDEFGMKKGNYPYEYGPNSLLNVDQISIVNGPVFPKNYNTKYNNRFNHNTFSQKTPLQPPSPLDPSPYNINAFQPSNFSKFGFQTLQPSYLPPQTYDQNNYDPTTYQQNYDQTNYDKVYSNSNINQQGVYNQNYFGFDPNYDSTDWYRQATSAAVTQYNPNEWWKYVSPSRSDTVVGQSAPRRVSRRGRRKRNAELVRASKQRPLSGTEALRIALGLASAETSGERARRQAPGTTELCRSRTEYVTPQAAMNNRGSWRYVVNMPTNMTQLVKVEICQSTECNGLCRLPFGYSSKCQQKFIQKRLVALQTNGQNLYTDLFWIPSCCQCVIVQNDI